MKEERNLSMEYIDHICNQLKLGCAAVLVGAGLSLNADKRSSMSKEYPLWKDLGYAFAKKISHDSYDKQKNFDPTILAEQLEAAYGRNELDKTILETIPDEQYLPSELHKKLLRLPWVDIFTTNYDTLLERASEQIAYKRFNIVTCKEDLVGSAGAPRIIKLHGSFPSMRPFIITSEDYRSYPQKFAPFVNTVQQSLLENTFCMIGFSGNDPNFEKWIGWIRDNLNENSPFIYLITHEELSDTYIKFLYKRNVIVVNISSILPEGEDSLKYDAFIDYILERVPDDNPSWPSRNHYSELVQLCSQQNDVRNINEIIKIIKQMHDEYPGWLITPLDNRSTLKSIHSSLNKILYLLRENKCENELEFLYEYDWIREKCLLPPFYGEIESYKKIIDRNMQVDKTASAKTSMLINIIISLMRDCRESGEFERWLEYYQFINDNGIGIRHNLKQRLAYESCLYSFFTYNYHEISKKLGEWSVMPQDHLWALYKGGLLCEVNDLQEASLLLSGSLESLRRQLQSDDKNIYLLSLESAMMALIQHLSSVLNDELKFENSKKDNVNTPLEFTTTKSNAFTNNIISKVNNVHDSDLIAIDQNYYQIRQRIHQNLKVDWTDENNNFINNLTHTYVRYKPKSTKKSFDFGKSSSSTKIGEDKELLDAYAFLRFREETGHPFRIQNYIDGSMAAAGAAERIARFSTAWAIITLIRIDTVKLIENIITRPLISSLDNEKINLMAKFYSEALLRLDEYLDKNDWFFVKDFVGRCASVLPAVLSRLCCKSSTEILDEILVLLLQIYNSKNLKCYKETNQLVDRLMAALSAGEKTSYIATLIQFPFIPKEDLYTNFIDPMRYVSLSLSYSRSTFVEVEIEGTNDLINKAKNSNELGEFAFGRLFVLSNNGLLTREQHKIFLEIIEQKNFKVPNWFYSSALFYINMPDELSIKAKKHIKEDLINRLYNFISIQGLRSEKILFAEYLSIASQDVFLLKDVDELIGISNQLIQKLSKYTDDDEVIISVNKLVRMQIREITTALANILVNNLVWETKTETTSLMEELFCILDTINFSCPYLRILWGLITNKNFDQSSIVCDLLSPDESRQLGALDTLSFSIYNEDEFDLDQGILTQCLEIMCGQVMWRYYKNLEYTLYVIKIALESKRNVFSEDMIKCLIHGLSNLYNETEINIDDTVDSSNDKGSIRIASYQLAYSLSCYYSKYRLHIPDEISKWMNIVNNLEEFAEIRNAIQESYDEQ